MIRDAIKLHDDNVYHLPLHFQFIPWAARANVSVEHRSSNALYVPWVTIN